jgi:hypothetical protein
MFLAFGGFVPSTYRLFARVLHMPICGAELQPPCYSRLMILEGG